MPTEENTSFAPKDNAFLLGHETAEKRFLVAWKNNSLHQSWLISGLKGVGKATFAYKIARFILNADENNRQNYNSIDVPQDNEIFKQIAQGSCPDFKLLERSYIKTEKQKIIKAIKDGNYMSDDELKDLKKSAVIAVDDVRTVNEFLAKKSANGKWRVVIIDSVDDMNASSANAILKILEEPPARTLMLLISHNPAKLLPTIKSRCIKIELKPLQDNQVASLLRRYRPNLSEAVIKKTAALAGGSIGKAIAYADGEATQFYDNIYALASQGTNFKTSEMLEFCDEVSKSEENYDLFKELILKFLSEQAKALNKVAETTDMFDQTTKIFVETESLNLDKRLAVMNIMTNICKIY